MVPLRYLYTTGIAVCMAMLGCSSAIRQQDLRIYVLPDTVELAKSELPRAWFTVSVKILNQASRRLLVTRCGPTTERLVGSQWRPVVFPSCIGAMPPLEVAPRDSVTIPVTVESQEILFGSDLALVPGTYRVVFRMAYEEPNNPVAPADMRMPSSPFVVIGRPM